ncbi:hypothetical protein D3C73_944850 [compost metagenome]
MSLSLKIGMGVRRLAQSTKSIVINYVDTTVEITENGIHINGGKLTQGVLNADTIEVGEPSNAQECLDTLCKAILGESYYIESPVGGNQANTIVTQDILHRLKLY